MSSRPYKMAMWPNSPSILTYRGPQSDPFTPPDSLVIERPFRCTILCLWRSIFRVRHATVSFLVAGLFIYTVPGAARHGEFSRV